MTLYGLMILSSLVPKKYVNLNKYAKTSANLELPEERKL
jgi:hypothetical protein